jgi:hypothetical protein
VAARYRCQAAAPRYSDREQPVQQRALIAGLPAIRKFRADYCQFTGSIPPLAGVVTLGDQPRRQPVERRSRRLRA